MARARGPTLILLAALVVLTLLVIYAVCADPEWAQPGYWLANYVETPEAVYARSDGTFDAPARLALERARGRPAPTAFDHALSGTIIARNLLQREHRPAVGPDGAPTREAVELAARRREMLGEARGHFMAAVDRLGVARHGREAPPPRGRRATAGGAGFVLDAAADFAFGGLVGALANDPLMAVLVAEEWGILPDGGGAARPPLELFDPAMLVDAPLAAATFQRRGELVADRQAAARQAAEAEGGALGAAAETYVALAVQHTDDAQNAHDSSTLACLRAVVGRLRADQEGQALPELAEVRGAIEARASLLAEGRPQRVADALAVVDKAAGGERVVALDATDGECLRRVWHRCGDPRNAGARLRLQQAVFDALCDCWEAGILGRHIVCVTGRATRILSSLVLLDWDERNWVVKRLEQFKNDIFERARGVIQQQAEAAAQSPDPDYRRAGQLYLATSLAASREAGEVPASATDALADSMRAAILEMIAEYLRDLEAEGLKDAIPAHMVEAVKMEATAAVL